MNDALDDHVATLDTADLAEAAAAEVTSQRTYDRARSEEIRWEVLTDGTLTRAREPNPRTGMEAATSCAWGSVVAAH
jgi:hypothetical protein